MFRNLAFVSLIFVFVLLTAESVAVFAQADNQNTKAIKTDDKKDKKVTIQVLGKVMANRMKISLLLAIHHY